MPEQIKEEMKDQGICNLGENLKQPPNVQRAEKAAKKKAEIEKIQRQDRNGRATALLLLKKHYEEQFEKKGRVDRRTKQQKVKLATDQLERDFQPTNILTLEEQQQWEEAFKLADAGDKVRNEETKEQTMVKEITRSVYALAVWLEGGEPKEEDEAERGNGGGREGG